MGFLGKLFNRKPKPGRPLPVTDETFKQEVLSSDLPVAVDFWSKTCPPCHVMGGLLNELGPEYIGKLKIFKLNVDESSSVATRFRVQSLPTLILFLNGQPVDRVAGLLSKDKLMARLRDHMLDL